MPRKKQIKQCRAWKECTGPVLAGGCFCAQHEMLWIAVSGTTSKRVRRTQTKLYGKFCHDQRMAHEEAARRDFELAMQKNARKMLGGFGGFIREDIVKMAAMLSQGVEDDVHSTALYSLGEHAEVGTDRDNRVLVIDDGAEGRPPRSDRGLPAQADGSVGEGQSEVPASDVHWSSK